MEVGSWLAVALYGSAKRSHRLNTSLTVASLFSGTGDEINFDNKQTSICPALFGSPGGDLLVSMVAP